jgi:RNA polymerase sigma-70 factor, ECF subfamily
MSTAPSEVTRALSALADGDAAARERLWELVYRELKQMAQAQLARESGQASLVPTALVHEAYLRLLGNVADFDGRAHFFGAAGRAMRHILIEHARARLRDKRGGGVMPITWSPELDLAAPDGDALLQIDDALRRLESLDAAMVQVVELRWFGGLSVEETAVAMETSPRSVNRLWTSARAWLLAELAA